MAGPGRLCIADGLDEHPAEVDGLRGEFAPFVEAGEEQQVLDEFGHAHRLRLDAADRVRHVGRQVAAVHSRELGVPTDRRERGAQFMAGVGDEASHLLLTLLTSRERGCHVPEHAVEGGAEPSDLGDAIGLRHPLGEIDVAPVERKLGDGLGCRRHAGERSERAADHEPADDEREREPAHRHDRDGPGELHRLGVDVGEGQCKHAAHCGLRLDGERAVFAEGSGRDRVRLAVGGNLRERLHRRRVGLEQLAALGDVRTAD
jgi:hypothetical protein